MSAADNLIYEFGPFVLEPHARRLSRHGESVSLAASEFELLLLLVRNPGRVVEKREIMETVWPDVEVEENNLTVRMSSLRRALGETKGHHPYIQTVTGRGYCLITDVKELPSQPGSIGTPETVAKAQGSVINTGDPPEVNDELPKRLVNEIPPGATRRKWEIGGFRLYAVLLVGLLASSVLYGVLRRQSKNESQALAQSMKMSRATHTGRVMGAAVSPDGQSIAYVERDDEMSSLWLQRAGTNNPLQLRPPAKLIYKDPSFSPDGNTLYYSKCQPSCQLYTMPILGGVETALDIRADCPVTFSPDGKRMAYLRVDGDGTGTSVIANVIVADADGTGSQVIHSRTGGSVYQYGAAAWSSDGKTIAFPLLLRESGQAQMKVIGIAVANGAESTLTSQPWRYIRDVSWLPSGDGFIMNARDEASAPEIALQIWRVSYPGGEARRITNDLNNYMQIRVSADGNTLIALEMHFIYGLWIAPAENLSAATQLTRGTIDRRDGYLGLTFAPDGRIIYVSDLNGKRDLWALNADGTGQTQLTDGAHRDFYPNVTPDGRYIVFESTREGSHNVWRVDADGRNLKRLTFGGYDAEPVSSPDGKWVVYVAHEDGRPPKLRKVSIDGGISVQLTEEYSMHPTYSPDGKLIAYYRMDMVKRDRRDIVIIPAGGGAPVKILSAPKNFGSIMRWAPAGDALTYRNNTLIGLWRMPLDGSQPTELATLRGEHLMTFCYSHDGRRIAYSSGPNMSDVILIKHFN